MVVDERTMSPQQHTYTADELAAFAERASQDMLGLSWVDATRALDSGQLAGTAAEAELRMLKFLLES